MEFLKMKKVIVYSAICLSLSISPLISYATNVMDSSNFGIENDSVNIGGSNSSSANFGVRDTVGEISTTRSNGGIYYARIGYQELVSSSTFTHINPPEEQNPTPAPITFSGNGPVFNNLFDIRDLSVLNYGTMTIISWVTTDSAKSKLIYSEENGDARQEIIIDEYRTSHNFILNNLEKGKKYIWSIQSVDKFGHVAALANQIIEFKSDSRNTANIPAPSNVSELSAISGENNSIILKWKIPENVSMIRIVKNSSFYPLDPYHGEIVFEGNSSDFEDKEIKAGSEYYYSVFSIDENGKYSSGTLISVKTNINGEIRNVEIPKVDEIKQSGKVDSKLQGITFNKFIIIQNNKSIPIENNSVKIDGEYPFTILIPYKDTAEVLKSFIVTLEDKEQDKAFSFMLRINESKTAYEATVDALNAFGNYNIKISIIDYSNKGVRQVAGTMQSNMVESINFSEWAGAFIGVIFLLIAFVLRLWRNRNAVSALK